MTESVGLDIRAPIGGLFSVLGLMLAGYGAFAGAPTPTDINIDLWWGLVMLVFGISLLIFARRAMKQTDAP
ncbi:MAG: hypothetical protein ABJF01_24405 [bacterium]